MAKTKTQAASQEETILNALTHGKGLLWLWREIKDSHPSIGWSTFYNHFKITKSKRVNVAVLNACKEVLKREGML